MKTLRNVNASVSSLKKEVLSSINECKKQSIHTRSSRQLQDGEMFLDMISKEPYKKCITINDLIKAIREEREKLNTSLNKLKKYEPGYQISLFEACEEVSESNYKEYESKRKEIAERTHWLHKCLGICLNPEYFT